MEDKKIEMLPVGKLEKLLYSVTIEWAKKEKEVVYNITYVTYQVGGNSFGFGSDAIFMKLHGINGKPVDIIKLDGRINRVKIENSGQSVPA